MTKRVESILFPCLDEGSTPSSSTALNGIAVSFRNGSSVFLPGVLLEFFKWDVLPNQVPAYN